MRRLLAGGALLLGLGACRGAAPPGARAEVPAAGPAVARIEAPAVAVPSLSGCCEQCLGASARNPGGFDLRMERCLKYGGQDNSQYNGGPGVDGACVALFDRRGTRVAECQSLLAR